MDTQSLKVLEFDKIQEALSRLTISKGGKRAVLSLTPHTSIYIIRKMLRIITQFKEIIEQKDTLPMFGMKDTETSLKKAGIEGAVLESIQLYNIGINLQIGKNVKSFFRNRKDAYPDLYPLVQDIVPLKALLEQIVDSIDPDGYVLDKASPELRRLRREIVNKEEAIRKKLDKVLRRYSKSGYTMEDIVTIRDGRGVIPVREEFAHKAKGIAHHRSSTGATIFVEPLEIIDVNNTLEELRLKEEREIRKILKNLTDSVRINIQNIVKNEAILVEIDLYYALSMFSIEIDGKEPIVSEERSLDIKNGRHPLLLFKKATEVVPLSVKIGERYKTLVISGPNAGGKTVALKTVGLLSLMVQCGMHVPADDDSVFPVFEKIFCDIGDEQSIEKDLSTFSSHLERYKNYIVDASKENLTLIDEIGTGTDPKEGSAIAIAVLDKLTDSGGITIVTTHQSTIKVFAYKHPNMENGSMIFDETNLKPTYQFNQGIPGSSYAFEISRRLDFPEDVLSKSRELVGVQENKLEEMIKELQKNLKQISDEKSQIDIKRTELDGLLKLYNAKASTLKDFTREKKQEALREAEEILESSNQAIERAIREIKESSANKESIKKAKEIVGEQKKIVKNILRISQKSEQVPGKIEVGNIVLHKELRVKGEVLSLPDSSDKVWISIGTKKLETDIRQLEKIDNGEKRESISYDKVPIVHIEDKIDLRGMDSIDAVNTLKGYLKEASMMGLKEVYIIHGKGTGVLKKKVNEYLQDYNKIKSKRAGQWNEGGEGVTIVRF
ncbi:endonuclease MutS2 [candidate division KSB1 bacterium]